METPDKNGLPQEHPYHEKNFVSSSIPVVGVGASAGGLEAIQEFLTGLPQSLEKCAFIVAQHVSPSHKSMLVQLLSKGTSMQVKEAEHGEAIAANTLYITPPDKDITVANGAILLSKPQTSVGPKPSVDLLFQSLANAVSPQALVGVILSGTGSDGAIGAKAIYDAGGLVLVQDPITAKYDGMPVAASQSGGASMVLIPNEMGNTIDEFLDQPDAHRQRARDQEANEHSLQKIFKLLSKRTGTDFSNYKSATILRRLSKRLNQLQMPSLEVYLDFVHEHPEELDQMFQMILIGVTTFFRDREAFEALEGYLEQVIRNKSAKDNVRIWIPGCSTGEEPYSIAILLYQIMQQKGKHLNIQIFATDIDEVAIATGRRGVYNSNSLQDVPKEIIDTYFLRKGEQYELVKSIRSMVLFSKHDVTNNPPFLKLDLISCRNLLIYFGSSLQHQIIPVFHYSLNLDGILFLGKSESIGQFGDLFSTTDSKNKIFQRKRGSSIHAVKFSAFKPQRLPGTPREVQMPVREQRPASIGDMVKESMYNHFEHPYVVVNEAGEIEEITGDVRLFLTLPQGELQANLMKMINPELQIEARSVFSRCIKEKQLIKGVIKHFTVFEQVYHVRMSAFPLVYQDTVPPLHVVVFERLNLEEITGRSQALNEEDMVNSRIEELEQELNATKEHLQTYIEEIETSNEELQSLNEEMQSTNEELQSSNEELETSNEELQSTNEEIQIAYAELKAANEELERKEKLLRDRQFHLEALLNNSLQAFLLIDHKYHIQAFNESANLICGLLHQRTLRRGESLVDFTTAANLEHVINDIKRAFDGEMVTGVRAEVSVYGAEYWFEYSLTPVMDHHNRVQVVSYGLIDITESHKAKHKLESAQQLLHAVFNASINGICISDRNGKLLEVNEAFCRIFGFSHEELTGASFGSLIPIESREHIMHQIQHAFIERRDITNDWKLLCKDGSVIDAYVNTQILQQDGDNIYQVTAVKDLTENKKYRSLLESAHATVRAGGWEFDAISGEFQGTSEFYQIIGIKPDTPIDIQVVASFFREEAQATLTNAFQKSLQHGDVFDLELELQSNSIKTQWIRITCKPVRVYQKTVKMFGTLQDITDSKKNEIWLKLIESAVTHANDAVVIAKTSDGSYDGLHIRYANHAFESLTGFQAVDVISHHPQMIFGELSDAGNLARLKKVIENREKYSTDVICYRKDGSRFWNNISLSPVSGIEDTDYYWVMIQRDVSDQKAQEKQQELYEAISVMMNQGDTLNASLTRLVAFLAEAHEFEYAQVWLPHMDGENMHLAASWCKPHVEDKANKLLANSLSGKHGLGHPAIIQPKPSHYLLSVQPEDDAGDSVRETLREAGFMSAICFPVYSATELVCALTFFTTQAQHPLHHINHTLNSLAGKLGPEVKRQKAEEEINRFFDVSPDVLCIAGTDGYFKRVNPAFCDMLGLTREELLAKPIVELVHPDDRNLTAVHLEKNIHGDPTIYFENRYITKSNNVIWFAWTSVTILDEGLIFAVAKDVTNRKKAEQELSRLNESLKEKATELEDTNKELEQFAYVASHDLQEPLRMVSSFLGLLEKKYNEKLDDQGRSFIHMAVDGASRMRQIILDLLEFSRVGRLETDREEVDTELLLKTVLLQSQRLIEESKTTILVDALPKVRATRTLLQQVFQNLIGNAIKYAKPAQLLTIKISATREKKAWRFSVSDNGIGISEEYHQKIFVIFQRLHTHSEHPGSGIGLAICKKIVEFHGGKIWVESDGQSGSTFHFTIADG